MMTIGCGGHFPQLCGLYCSMATVAKRCVTEERQCSGQIGDGLGTDSQLQSPPVTQYCITALRLKYTQSAQRRTTARLQHNQACLAQPSVARQAEGDYTGEEICML